MPTKTHNQVISISQEAYMKAFGMEAEKRNVTDSKQYRAHCLALDIRKFEIELYWKRAGYFWTFIAATLAGFVVVQKENTTNSVYLSIILSCVGLVFSFAWFCVNKGSKYWQENWENHVDLLEDDMVGPLYKVVTSRPQIKGSWMSFEGFRCSSKALITGPSAFSVSKINQIISLFVVLLWVALLWQVLPPFTFKYDTIEWKYVLPVGMALLACGLILVIGKTDPGNYEGVRATLRKTKIADPD